MIFNWNSKKILKISRKFQFLSNFQFLGSTTLCISRHNLAELWPRSKICSPKYPSRIPLKVSRRHTYGNPSRLGDIGKDIRGGVKMTPLGVYVDQKSLVFPGLKMTPYSYHIARISNAQGPRRLRGPFLTNVNLIFIYKLNKIKLIHFICINKTIRAEIKQGYWGLPRGPRIPSGPQLIKYCFCILINVCLKQFLLLVPELSWLTSMRHCVMARGPIGCLLGA